MSADSHSAAFCFLSLPVLGYSSFGTVTFSNVLSLYEIDLKECPVRYLAVFFTIKDNEINLYPSARTFPTLITLLVEKQAGLCL